MPIINLGGFGLQHTGHNRLALCLDQGAGNSGGFGLNFGDHVINNLYLVQFGLFRTGPAIPRGAQKFRQFLGVSEDAIIGFVG